MGLPYIKGQNVRQNYGVLGFALYMGNEFGKNFARLGCPYFIGQNPFCLIFGLTLYRAKSILPGVKVTLYRAKFFA